MVHPRSEALANLAPRLARGLRAAGFPAFMLALALGALLAVFSLFEQIVLRPLPGEQRLVTLEMEVTQADGRNGLADPSPVELREAEAMPWLESGPVQQDFRPLRVLAGGATRSAMVAYASADYFTALGLRPSAGRLFSRNDPEPGAVLSWAAWKLYAGLVPLGGPVTVDGVTLQLLGVLPQGFTGTWPGFEPEIWVTLEARARSGEREARHLADRNIGLPTFARLRPGVTPAQAEAALVRQVAAWAALRTPPLRTARPRVRPVRALRLEAWGHFLPAGGLLWAATGLLVGMAMLNLGNLQVARWMQDRGNWATRVALGCSPRRMVLELSLPMVGTLALGALGALPLAWALVQLIARFPPPSEYPTVLVPGLDLKILLAALALVAILALPLTLLAWAWFLRQSSHGGQRGAVGGLRWRKALLGTQIALSVLLLSGTASSLRDLARARGTRLGFDPGGIQAFSFAFPVHIPGGREAVREGWTRLYDRFREAPGCQATCVMVPPCEAYDPTVEPFRADNGRQADCLPCRIYPGAFRLLHIPLLLGRDFADSDGPDAPPVAVISAPLARILWPDQSPLDQVLEDGQGRRSRVIGVVADPRWEGLKRMPHMPLLFHPARQRFGPLLTLLVRSPLPPAQLHAWVEQEVARLDPRLTIQRAEPLAARVERMLQPQRLAATLFGMLGAAALALSLLGLYVLQYHLTLQRLPEAGLRMALGATPDRVRATFLSGLAWPMGVGLGAGALATLAGWRLLGAAVTGLPGLGGSTLALVAIGLAGTGLLAAALPLRRLARVSPADLLRDPGN